MFTKTDKIIMGFPYVLSFAIFFVNFYTNIIHKELPGYENVLASIITFTSIIIGVLVALFGVVVTLSDSDIMKKLQKNKGDKVIFKYCIETLSSNFALLILSVILQSIIEFTKELPFTQIIISCWIAILVLSITSSIRTIYFLLLISFHHNDRTKRPENNFSISDEERRKLRERSSKIN